MADEQFTMGTWRGRKMWNCNLCKFNTLNEGAFMDHWRANHRAVPPPPPPPSPVLVADKRGKEVSKRLKRRPRKVLPVQETKKKKPAKSPLGAKSPAKKVEVKKDGKATVDSTATASEVPDAAGHRKRG